MSVANPPQSPNQLDIFPLYDPTSKKPKKYFLFYIELIFNTIAFPPVHLIASMHYIHILFNK